MSSPLVSFLIAGVQKAGTTALFDYLQDHGEIGLPAIKEPHFFDDEAVDWSKPDYTAYHALFPRREETLLFGEATPITLYWPNAIERALAYNPYMKFIILLRDPVERAFSHWRMEKSRGGETEAFSWCIREGRSRVNSKEAPGHHRVYSYVERGFYAEQIKQLLEVVPSRHQIMVLSAKELATQPQSILRKITIYLGLEELTDTAPRSVHVTAPDSEEISPADRTYLEELYQDQREEIRNLIGYCPSL